MFTEVVRLVGEAVPARAAGDVRPGNDAVARLQRPAVLSEDLTAGRLDHADVLVPADERVLDLPFVRRAGVLEGLATPGVLVRAAYPGVADAHQDRPRLRLGDGKPLDLQVTRRSHHGCPHIAHRITSNVVADGRNSGPPPAASRN